MQEPGPKSVNVFEVLRQVGANPALRNGSSSVAACAAHIHQMMDGVLARERWALMMVDASAKLPEPLLGGLNVHLGDYDQCLRARSEAFAGRYCLVAAMGQRVAACVPSTCTWRSLDRLLADGSDGAVRVPAHTCQAADDPVALHPATVLLGLVLLLLVLNALGWSLLALEGVRRRLPAAFQPSPQLVAAMSPAAAWRKICGARRPRSPRAGERGAGAEAGSAGGAGEAGGSLALLVEKDRDDWSWALSRLSAANGLRTLSMVWVVLGHRDALMAQLPALDTRLLPERMKQWAHVYVPAALFAVDTFLFLTGCVLAFTVACKRSQYPRAWRRLVGALPQYYLHRYIRLTPLMAFIMVLYAGGLHYLGDGPLWNQFSDFEVNSCRTNWWPNFLYIHNYYNNPNMCIGHSWYLAVDMQLYLISPFLVFPVVDYWNTGRFYYGRWVLSLFLVLSIGIPFAIVAVYDLTPAPNPIGDRLKNALHSELVYTAAHARAAPWALGVGAGAWAARVAGGRRALGRWTARGLWACAAGALVGLPLGLTGALRAAAAGEPSRWASACFVALSKPLWALGLAAVVVLCAAGSAPRLDALLSWRPLEMFSRLSFAVYLLHPTVQAVTGWSTRGTTVVTDVVTIPMVVSDVALTFALALPVSILVESPFIALEKLLLRGGGGDRRDPPLQPAPGAPRGRASAPDDLEASAQPREGGASPTTVLGRCRVWLQSLRETTGACGSRARNNSGDRTSSRSSSSSSSSGSGDEPTEMREAHRYSSLRQVESPPSSREASPSERPSPSERSSAGELQLPSRPSNFRVPESFVGSAVSSSDESKQHPLAKGGSSENLRRVPSGEKLLEED